MNKKLGIVKSKLANGFANEQDAKDFRNLLQRKYKKDKENLDFRIELEAAKDLYSRLRCSVFSELMKDDPIGYKRWFIKGQYHNMKVRVEMTKSIFKIFKDHPNYLEPETYGISREHDFYLTDEDVIHIWFRHHESYHLWNSKEEVENDYQPTLHSTGLMTEAISLCFMSLNSIKKEDWRKAQEGKNLIVDVEIAGRVYTITRKGESKRIISIYPRGDERKTNIKLERTMERMALIRK